MTSWYLQEYLQLSPGIQSDQDASAEHVSENQPADNEDFQVRMFGPISVNCIQTDDRS